MIVDETVWLGISVHTCYCIIHVTEITEKLLLDCNPMYNFTVYRVHGYCYCLLLLLLFTAYTITFYCYTVLLLSLYHSSNSDNMNID